MQDAREEPTEHTGRAAVRRHLLARLDEAGLARPKGVTAAAHDAMHDRLAQHLAYMATDNLMTLAEVVMDHAVADGRAVWPSEALVRQLAHALQAPPVEQRRIVSSWLASIEGPQAELGGYLVELYRFLVRHGRPPMAMDYRQLREEAAGNQRDLHLLRGRVERGCEQPTDRAWLVAFERDLRVAREVVAAGAARRDGQVVGGVVETGDAA